MRFSNGNKKTKKNPKGISSDLWQIMLPGRVLTFFEEKDLLMLKELEFFFHSLYRVGGLANGCNCNRQSV